MSEGRRSRLTIWIPRELSERMTRLAAAAGQSPSRVLRDALAHRLDEIERTAVPPTPPSPAGEGGES